jgi:spermidine/putrescine transport system substrate-binding protein
MRNLLAAGDIWLTSADDGMIHKMMLQNQPMKFFVPKEGAAAWIDQFCIVADGPNKEAAYRWIDHMLSPEIASQMIQKMGYMVVNAKVVSALPPEMAKLMTYTDEETKRLVLSNAEIRDPREDDEGYHDVRGQ